MSDQEKPTLLPFSAILASLVSFGALATTGRGYGVLSFCGLGLIATYFVSWRLRSGSWSTWMVRVAVFGVVIIANVVEPATGYGHGLYRSYYIHGFGQLCAAELVVQAWRARPSGGPSGAYALLLSGFVYLTACNTFTNYFISLFTPAYMFFLGLTFWALRPTLAGNKKKGRTWSFIGGGALLLVLLIGFAASQTILHNRRELVGMVQDLDLSFMGRGEVGFSDSPRLQSGLSMGRSMVRVLLVENTYPGTYLHGMAFEEYEKGRWLPPIRGRESKATDIAELDSPFPGTPTQFTRLNDDIHLLFAPLHSAGVVPSRIKQVLRDTMDPAMVQVKAPAPYSYSVVRHSNPEHQGPLCEKQLDPEHRARCLVVPPEIKQEIHQLAARIGKGKSDPRVLIGAVESYLQTNHRYSLETDVGSGEPLSNFLIGRKDGHCEFFASAACILLRCLKVPTRYVIGFYLHETLGPERWVARQQDAHAWAESWVDGIGWVTVDGTPADSGRPNTTSEKPPIWQRAWEWISDAALDIGDWLYELSWAQLGLMAGGLGGGTIGILWLREMLSRGARRFGKDTFSYTVPDQALDELKQRFERFMANQGFPCPPHLPWSEHLAEVARAGLVDSDSSPETPAVAPVPQAEKGQPVLESARSFARAYARLRFGPSRTLSDADQLAAQLTRMET